MPLPFLYSVDNKTFYSRYDLLNYCLEQSDPMNTFNTAQFTIPELPTHLDLITPIDPVVATGKWIQDFKDAGKKIVLHFSGGIDSMQVLNNMIEAKTPPDYLYILSRNPFDQPAFISAMEMEFKHTLDYAKELITNNSIMKHTKIWYQHLDKKVAEQWFSSDDWIKQTSYFHNLEVIGSPKYFPQEIWEDNDYVFIFGANKVELRWNDNQLEFFFVDITYDALIDRPRPKNLYNYGIDNPDIFRYFCKRTYEMQKSSSNTENEKGIVSKFECLGYPGDRRFWPENEKFTSNMIPQLDKRLTKHLDGFNSKNILEDLDNTNEFPYYAYLHRNSLKAWLLYLEAEFYKPDWFSQYKKTFLENQRLIHNLNSFPGKLSQIIKTNITK